MGDLYQIGAFHARNAGETLGWPIRAGGMANVQGPVSRVQGPMTKSARRRAGSGGRGAEGHGSWGTWEGATRRGGDGAAGRRQKTGGFNTGGRSIFWMNCVVSGQRGQFGKRDRQGKEEAAPIPPSHRAGWSGGEIRQTMLRPVLEFSVKRLSYFSGPALEFLRTTPRVNRRSRSGHFKLISSGAYRSRW